MTITEIAAKDNARHVALYEARRVEWRKLRRIIDRGSRCTGWVKWRTNGGTVRQRGASVVADTVAAALGIEPIGCGPTFSGDWPEPKCAIEWHETALDAFRAAVAESTGGGMVGHLARECVELGS